VGQKSWESAGQEVARSRHTAADFLTEEITGPKNFIFAPKFPTNWKFLARVLYLWKKIFDKRNIFRQAKI